VDSLFKFRSGDINVPTNPEWQLPFPGFGIPLQIDLPERRMQTVGGSALSPSPAGIIAPVSDTGFMLTVKMENLVGGRLLFATKTIDPSFQNSRILVWSEIVVAHTYPLMVEPLGLPDA
jgi:hypothetical protein